jgi:hypothetical protein
MFFFFQTYDSYKEYLQDIPITYPIVGGGLVALAVKKLFGLFKALRDRVKRE